ncbi:C-C motif chemokine 4-like [Petaurus breviceps papuanus]|uniref:C-C motif chemokine 4-like n=1 Tax=Petaurus breviceps papuanus TaxID=3040969 RepID=UPI0036DE583B
MRNSMVIFSVLIIATDFCYQASSLTVGSDTPTACCFSYTIRKIPRAFVVDFYETNSQCSQPAIIFLTKKGNQACANPSDPWVQKYIKELKGRPGSLEEKVQVPAGLRNKQPEPENSTTPSGNI